MKTHTILITGAAGALGTRVTRALAQEADPHRVILATDVREVPAEQRQPGVRYLQLDITRPEDLEVVDTLEVDTVVHLAAIVTPPPGDTRALQYTVDVEGTRNVLEACVRASVSRFVYTSSGAAYGYHADHPPALTEDDAVRGNEIFAYAYHKRLVEEMLATYRQQAPDLEQVVFRVSTILGADVANQITDLFERPVVVGLRGVDSPFCFIWDEDAAACIVCAIHGGTPGIYNLTGDGVMTLREIAGAMGGRFVGLPVGLLQTCLGLAKARQWVEYGPEQVLFLQHRPVLANDKLKQVFGWSPTRSTRQAFEVYRQSRLRGGAPPVSP